MMILNTVSKKTSPNSALVYWRVGTKRKGILEVKLDFSHEEIDLIAELIAIKHLAFNTQVFGREPGAGSGYKFVVSKGAIRKLALGKSDKKFASKYAAFLTGRMSGATIAVSQDMEFMSDLETESVEILQADKQTYTQTFDEIHSPVIGSVLLTQHAIDQFTARISSGDPKKPWASLVGRLQHPKLKIEPLDAKVAAHKARKYGRSDNIEVWSHPDDVMKYLMVLKEGKRVLVTVFERNKSFDIDRAMPW